MIIDRLEHLSRYAGIHPSISEIVEYLNHTSLYELEAGRHQIQEDSIYVNIEQIKRKNKTEAQLEAHRKFMDIQIPLETIEIMGYTPVDLCAGISIPYSEEKDILFLRGQAQSYFTVEPGMFAIFMPQDAHAPGITPIQSKKAIFKVKI